MVGGFSSLMGSIATGARVGRFDTALPASAFRGNSPALYVLGTLMLWFG
jgi:ammonia channel protein AmtB